MITPQRVRTPTSLENRRLVRWVGALVLAAIGLWCSSAVLDIVGGSSGIVRVALVPPWWLLGALALILGAVGAIAARARRDFDVVLPVCALGVLALPYFPYLPDRLPFLRTLAGPARYLLWFVVGWLVAAAVMRDRRWLLGGSPSALFIFLAGVAVSGILAWRLIGTPLFPGGDEPHYLVITQSLLRDGDLRIEDNHERGEYRAYFNRQLNPHYLTRGVDGQIYSVHPVGLPVLAMPAFAVGGYRGVVAMVVLMAAAASMLLWQWARETTGSASAATFAWAALALTAPYLFNSFTVYPEIPGALAVMVALAWRTNVTTVPSMFVRGVAIGALPWLSTKYAPMAAAITMVLLLRTGWNLRAVAALLGPVVIALAGWFAFFFWIWGTLSPSAPYGSSEPMTMQSLSHGAPGLFFDQEYGVVAQAPILIVGFLGLIQMLRSGGAGARRAIELMVVLGALVVTVGAFHIWWGGSAMAGRPLTSGVLLLGLPIASLFASTSAQPSARAGCHLLLATSIAIACTLAAAENGNLLHNDRDGTAALLGWASPTWALWPAFPSFIAGSLTAAVGRTLAWLTMMGVVAWVIHLRRPQGFGASALATLLLGFAGTVVVVSFVSAVAEMPPGIMPEGRARVSLLDRFDERARPTAIIYDPLSLMPAAHALSRVTLTARRGSRTERQPIELLWNARFALPAGEYRVQVTRDATAAPETALALQIGSSGPPLPEWNVSDARFEHRFALPIDSGLVGFRAPPILSQGDGELQIAPLKIVDEGQRLRRPPVVGAIRQGPSTVFFHDNSSFPEPTGYWIRGGGRTEVTYATATKPELTIAISVGCGPVANQIALRTPDWQQRVVVEPGATTTVAIPTMEQAVLGMRLTPLEISVRDGFVPAQIDRSTTDQRFLGCWVTDGSSALPQHAQRIDAGRASSGGQRCEQTNHQQHSGSDEKCEDIVRLNTIELR